jgi:hypothetical protein
MILIVRGSLPRNAAAGIDLQNIVIEHTDQRGIERSRFGTCYVQPRPSLLLSIAGEPAPQHRAHRVTRCGRNGALAVNSKRLAAPCPPVQIGEHRIP